MTTDATEVGSFRRLARVALPYAPDMVVEKWRSTASGLTLLWAQFESPMLNAYITLASEIFEDSGVPHTLEHLVFLGSQLYPYKGVLDSLANRAFAQGTNAWTANDHTAYTLTTAGADGFLRMLPVYCDHVFFPTLTDAGFLTEVYHINGQLEDAGVVYSEMQGRENTSADLMELKTQRMLYPRSSAYRSETGGLMAALRVLTIDDIRRYHAQYYTPHNAALVLCGPLDRAALFDTLRTIDQRFVDQGVAHGEHGPRGWRRPFMETPSSVPPVIRADTLQGDGVDDADPPADARRRRVFVEFPETDESVGEVQVSWIGPTLDETLTLHAIDVLSTYLTDSPVSPLQHALVERDEPLCTDIYFGTTERAGAAVISASFASVPSEHLDTLDVQLDELLAHITRDGIDMSRMATILRRERERLLSQLETRPADCFSDVLVHEFLYGKSDGSQLAHALDDMRRFDQLDTYTSRDWCQLLTTYFLQQRVVVVGRPSARLGRQLKSETQARVDERRQRWGDEGARQHEAALQDARLKNDTPIPPAMLSDFAVPSSDTIQWIPVATGTAGPVAHGEPALTPTPRDDALQRHLDSDAPSPPFSVQFDHVSSQFVLVSVVLSTAALPRELRPYMTLYLAMLFSLPVRLADGTRLEYTDVVARLDEDVLEYDAAIGIGSSFSEVVALEFKAPAQRYEALVQWIHTLLWRSEFTTERVRVAAAKLAQSLPEQKRDGRVVAWAVLRAMIASDDSTCAANTVLTQAHSVPDIVQRLQDEPDAVLTHLEQVRAALLQPQHVRVSVAGDILSMPAPVAPWRAWPLQPAAAAAAAPAPLPWASQVLTPLGRAPAQHGHLCTVAAMESSYAVFTARGLPDFTHKDYAPLVVTLTILNAMESFLWRYIRGAGLAYGASIRNDAEAQHLHFILYRAPNAAQAFIEGRKVIEALADRATLSDGSQALIDETMLESAKSSLHFSVADAESTVGAAALESFIDMRLKRAGRHRGRRLLRQASQVSLDDVQRCLRTYIVPLFDPKTSVCAVSSAPSTADTIRQQLTDVGYVMTDVEMPTSGGASDSDASSSGSDADDAASDTDASSA